MKAAHTFFSRYLLIETIGIALLWGFIYTIPLFMYYQNNEFLWNKIITSWIQFSSLLIVFILNFYILIPQFLHKKCYFSYIAILLVILPLICCFELKLINWDSQEPVIAMPSMSTGYPIEFSSEMPPPQGFRSNVPSQSDHPDANYWARLLMAFLVAGSAAAYKMMYYWIQEEKTRKQIEERLNEDNDPQPEFILVKSDYKIVKIQIDDILYIESANEYIKIYLAGGEMIMTFMRLKNMENELPKGKFLRVQRSFIVNLQKIKAVEKNKI